MAAWPAAGWNTEGLGGRGAGAEGLAETKIRTKKDSLCKSFFFLWGEVRWGWFVYGSGGPFPDLLHRNEPVSTDPSVSSGPATVVMSG